jgi:CRP-like cAMP-binding protein
MASPEDIEYLASTPLFQKLDREQLEFLGDHFEVITLSGRETLRKAGAPADTFYIVMEGLVDLYTRDKKQPKLVQTVGVGNVIGWSWAVAPYKWSYEVRAQTPAILAEFDAKAIKEKCSEDPAFGYAVMKRICDLMLDRLNHVRTQLSMKQAAEEAE